MSIITRIQSVLDIADSVDAFCIDMYGVLWSGTDFYEGVLDVLGALKKKGKTVFVLSNTTEPRVSAEEKYARYGLLVGVHYDGFLSSGFILEQEVNVGFFERFAGKNEYLYYVIGYKSPALFQKTSCHITTDIRQADFVYLGSPSTPEKIALDLEHVVPEMTEAVQLGIPAIVANPDLYAFKGDVKYCTQGLMGKWYENHGGQVTWFGKPFSSVFTYALRALHLPSDRVCMVGDTVWTDIAGGVAAGMKTLLITGTGMTASDLKQGIDLEKLCQAERVFPNYSIERFC